MKRTILMTMLALGLTLGANSAYAGCPSCRGKGKGASATLSTWEQVVLVVSSAFGVALIPH